MLAPPARAELGPQVERCTAREQQAAQHGPERLRHADRAKPGRDGLRDGVGLLGGEAAVLDREGGRVAGGEDVRAPAHVAVLVDGDVAVLVVRQAGDPGADQFGQRDNDVGDEARSAQQPESAVECRDGRGARDEFHPGVGERAAYSLARRGAEHLERLVLAGRHDDVGRLYPALAQGGGREERQLVERQQPAGAGRRGEREAKLGVGGDARDHLLDKAGAHRPAERDCARNRIARADAGCDDEQLVRDAVPVLSDDPVGLWLD